MDKAITPEIVVAYSQCPRKAFSLLHSEKIHALPEYVQLLKLRCDKTRKAFLKTLSQQPVKIRPYTPDLLNSTYDVLFDVTLTINGFTADCTCLSKAEGQSIFGNFCYEPTICTGTYRIYKEQKIRLLYIAYVLEQIQQTPIKRGQIITHDGKAHRINRDFHYDK